jgi:hypothetical protein
MTSRGLPYLAAVVLLTIAPALAETTVSTVDPPPSPRGQWAWRAEINAIPVEGSVQNVREIRVYVDGQLRATLSAERITGRTDGELEANHLDLSRSPIT